MPLPIRRGSLAAGPQLQRILFDNFEANLRSGELRKSGSRIRLQAQPFRLLVLLLRNAGEVVTREEICEELWPDNTFVDFEHGLAAAVNKVREAIGDSADGPKYIETLPKRGYRFIGKIKPEPPEVLPVIPKNESSEIAAAVFSVNARDYRGWPLWLVGVAAATLGAILTLSISRHSRESHESSLIAVPFTSYPGLETAPSFSRRTAHRSRSTGWHRMTTVFIWRRRWAAPNAS